MEPNGFVDVPTPIDFRDMREARAWAEQVTDLRPWRRDFFGAFVRHIATLAAPRPAVLELGSGPGFLAQALLTARPGLDYTMLDFSAAMHELARARLGTAAAGVTFLTRDFRNPDWIEALPEFDVVVSIQAVHELRHKHRAPALYGQVARVLRPDAAVLVCDHFAGPGGMSNTDLYMNTDEHVTALHDAGFSDVSCLLNLGGMVLHRARRSP